MMKSANCSLEFLRRISRRRRSAPNGVESISEYVAQRAALLTTEHLKELRTELPLLNLRFAAIVAPQFPHLQQQLKVLVDFFEDTADGVFPAGSDASRKETAFALRYTAKETDIIPDVVPEIGYADDSLIVRTVLGRHQDVFRDYCRFRKIRCSKISLAP
jgi:uncharacterized membrane protein YkvA (DUF1232 family)